jgi:amino-acid N-acetyltransferase
MPSLCMPSYIREDYSGGVTEGIMSITISKATSSNLDELLRLLTAVNLPHDGVAEHSGGFLTARDAEKRLVGCAGLERYGELALLRSVAVSPDNQGTGLGSKLTAALLDDAARDGIEEVILLTTTARDFFARRFGFIEAQRAAYDESLEQSAEWKLPRCASAVCMSFRIQRRQ